NEAFKIGDRIAVMKDGHVVQIGTPKEVIDEPANDYIVDFSQDIDRSKVLEAKHILTETTITVNMNDPVASAIQKMYRHSISIIFVENDMEQVEGTITKDDAVKAAKRKESMEHIIKRNIEVIHEEEYVSDIIPKTLDTKYPLAVVNDARKLQGI